MVDGPQFYDDPDIIQQYTAHRSRPDNPNDSLELPVTLELMGNVKYADILDLGCGTAGLASLLLTMNCRSYIGVEASQNMYELAQKNMSPPRSTVEFARIEDWTYPTEKFHIVVSRLAFHYLGTPTLETMLKKIFTALTPDGKLVFSVEHPVLTSSDKSAPIAGKGREDWTVDDYFVTGERKTVWMGKDVTKFHRTIEDYFRLVQSAGFNITSLRESLPQRHNFLSEAEYQRRKRIPLFLFLSARKG